MYAGAHILESDEEVDGENMWISGMWPPCGRPSLMSASDISQLEYWDNLALFDEVDMARRDRWKRDTMWFIDRFKFAFSGISEVIIAVTCT